MSATLAAEALAARGNMLPLLDDHAVAALTKLSEPVDDLHSLVQPIVKLVSALKNGRR